MDQHFDYDSGNVCRASSSSSAAVSSTTNQHHYSTVPPPLPLPPLRVQKLTTHNANGSRLNNLPHYQAHSRLHFIGSWRMTADALLQEWIQCSDNGSSTSIGGMGIGNAIDGGANVPTPPPPPLLSPPYHWMRSYAALSRRMAANGNGEAKVKIGGGGAKEGAEESDTNERNDAMGGNDGGGAAAGDADSMAAASRSVFIHIDMDAFFCSVALSLPANAHLRTQPVAAAIGTGHSEITSCNYIARSYGVTAGSYVADVRKRLCPHLKIVQYDLKLCAVYAETSYKLMFALMPWVRVDPSVGVIEVGFGAWPPSDGPPITTTTTTATALASDPLAAVDAAMSVPPSLLNSDNGDDDGTSSGGWVPMPLTLEVISIDDTMVSLAWPREIAHAALVCTSIKAVRIRGDGGPTVSLRTNNGSNHDNDVDNDDDDGGGDDDGDASSQSSVSCALEAALYAVAVSYAALLRRHVIRHCNGISASCGIGPSYLVSRLASSHAKPNGTYAVIPSSSLSRPPLAAAAAASQGLVARLAEVLAEVPSLAKEGLKPSSSALIRSSPSATTAPPSPFDHPFWKGLSALGPSSSSSSLSSAGGMLNNAASLTPPFPAWHVPTGPALSAVNTFGVEGEGAFMARTRVKDLFGVGKRTLPRLATLYNTTTANATKIPIGGTRSAGGGGGKGTLLQQTRLSFARKSSNSGEGEGGGGGGGGSRVLQKPPLLPAARLERNSSSSLTFDDDAAACVLIFGGVRGGGGGSYSSHHAIDESSFLCSHLQSIPLASLQECLGKKNGVLIYCYARGFDLRQLVQTGAERTIATVGNSDGIVMGNALPKKLTAPSNKVGMGHGSGADSPQRLNNPPANSSSTSSSHLLQSALSLNAALAFNDAAHYLSEHYFSREEAAGSSVATVMGYACRPQHMGDIKSIIRQLVEDVMRKVLSRRFNPIPLIVKTKNKKSSLNAKKNSNGDATSTTDNNTGGAKGDGIASNTNSFTTTVPNTYDGFSNFRLTFFHRHPSYQKEPSKYLGLGRCVEHTVTVRLFADARLDHMCRRSSALVAGDGKVDPLGMGGVGQPFGDVSSMVDGNTVDGDTIATLKERLDSLSCWPFLYHQGIPFSSSAKADHDADAEGRHEHWGLRIGGKRPRGDTPKHAADGQQNQRRGHADGVDDVHDDDDDDDDDDGEDRFGVGNNNYHHRHAGQHHHSVVLPPTSTSTVMSNPTALPATVIITNPTVQEGIVRLGLIPHTDLAPAPSCDGIDEPMTTVTRNQPISFSVDPPSELNVSPLSIIPLRTLRNQRQPPSQVHVAASSSSSHSNAPHSITSTNTSNSRLQSLFENEDDPHAFYYDARTACWIDAVTDALCTTLDGVFVDEEHMGEGEGMEGNDDNGRPRSGDHKRPRRRRRFRMCMHDIRGMGLSINGLTTTRDALRRRGGGEGKEEHAIIMMDEPRFGSGGHNSGFDGNAFHHRRPSEWLAALAKLYRSSPFYHEGKPMRNAAPNRTARGNATIVLSIDGDGGGDKVTNVDASFSDDTATTSTATSSRRTAAATVRGRTPNTSNTSAAHHYYHHHHRCYPFDDWLAQSLWEEGYTYTASNGVGGVCDVHKREGGGGGGDCDVHKREGGGGGGAARRGEGGVRQEEKLKLAVPLPVELYQCGWVTSLVAEWAMGTRGGEGRKDCSINPPLSLLPPLPPLGERSASSSRESFLFMLFASLYRSFAHAVSTIKQSNRRHDKAAAADAAAPYLLLLQQWCRQWRLYRLSSGLEGELPPQCEALLPRFLDF